MWILEFQHGKKHEREDLGIKHMDQMEFEYQLTWILGTKHGTHGKKNIKNLVMFASNI